MGSYESRAGRRVEAAGGIRRRGAAVRERAAQEEGQASQLDCRSNARYIRWLRVRSVKPDEQTNLELASEGVGRP